MTQVETVRGPVSVGELGTVLMHEHVFVLDEELRRNYPARWDEEQQVAAAIARLTEVRDRGVRTIVDPTVLGLGRDIERIARINEQVELNIIPATGLYTYNDVPFAFHFHGPGTLLGGDDQLVDMFVQDITEGIAGTGIKAAFLKCAIESELTPGVERVMKAVAQAHHRTGVPITVHTSPAHQTGLTAQEVFQREGVDLGNLVIGHSGDSADLDYLHRLIDNGSYVGMDRFGLDILLPGDQRVATVARLAKEGFADRMVLAQDASCHIDWFPPGVREAVAPNWHFTHIHDDVLPALRAAGVTEPQLDTMLVDNPRRYFSATGS
ncbi:phosphotriesterase-related protein [Tamaricihabitans halophyticus]|uniref:Phosphotriesterase-related protein n=1 Tax=Tamaricihabitans halophyticus TaxID=1262583 RepID=A0A4R2QSB4_9PSEU|nr:phosphotriesterase [Tamaricihabitans halophyticus]TCP52004.1 phosphotriesterase-related protein [Tamaricihabitans halophyticus]